MRKLNVLLFFLCSVIMHAQYPTDPTQDIRWNSGDVSIEDVRKAYNHARAEESKQLAINLPEIRLPTQEEWSAMTDDEQALWILNEERIARGVMIFSGISNEVSKIASDYAQFQGDNDAFGHSEDGQNPWQRLDSDPAIDACNDGSQAVENLYVAAHFNDFSPLSVAKAVYGWIYEDEGVDWGHRHACLRSDFKDNSGLANEEGLIGIGKAEVRNYQGPFSRAYDYATIVVFNVFDPCPDWEYEDTDTTPDTEAPSIPVELSLLNVNHKTAEISWETATDDRGVKGYQVFLNGKLYKDIVQTNIELNELKPETKYELSVKAYDRAGNYSNDSKILKFTTTEAPDCTEVDLTIDFDNYASETAWQLVKGDAVIASGDGYTNGASDIQETLCLEDGTYTFTITDSYNDGICCRYGEGSYSVNRNGVSLISGGEFTDKEIKTFVIGDVPAPETPTDLIATDVKATSAKLVWKYEGDDQYPVVFEVLDLDQNLLKTVESGKTEVTLTGLQPDTIYKVAVRAKNIEGEVSNVSGYVSFSTEEGTSGGEFSEEMLSLLELVNQARAKEGREALVMNAKLVAAAEFHANDMNDNNFFDHTGFNGSSVSDRVNDQEYAWLNVGENIARGQRSVEQVHNSWMNSDGHRRNILNANYTEIGLARVANYWVQVFGRPRNRQADDFINQDITLFPNYLSGSQNRVKISGIANEVPYKVYSLSGRKIQEGETTNKSIEFSTIPSGMYVVRMLIEDKVIVQKIVKQ